MNSIEKIQHEFGIWYETSSIAQFMSWWKFHLKSFVPEKHHKSLFADSNSIILLLTTPEDIQVWYQENGTEHLKLVTNEEDSEETWWHQTQHIVNKADGSPLSIEYLLPKTQVLVRKIALPAAAKDNLEDVIGYELDKYIPFNSDQVQLGYKVDIENSNDEMIRVDLAAIPNELLNKIIHELEEKSLPLSAIDVNVSQNETPKRLGVNLLPSEKRQAKDYTNIKINSVLLLLLIGLIYYVMSSSINAKQKKIDDLTEVNLELQKQARTSKLLRKELKQAIVSSRFLSDKQQSYKSPVRLISEVTTILPDHTYVTRLKINEEEIEISGESDNANGLIPKMDKSSLWYSPKIPQAIRPNSRTGKETFTIEASLQKPVEEGEDESAS